MYAEFMSMLHYGTAIRVAILTIANLVIANIVVRVARKVKRDRVSKFFDDTITGAANILHNQYSVLGKERVSGSMNAYENLFEGARRKHGSLQTEESIKKREEEYKAMITNFYDLVTDFYEYGWGQSFHFGPRLKGETFFESIKRYEYYLALRTGMGTSTRALDVGCGVGGPLRNIHQFSGSDITGITINEYQVRVANRYCKELGLEEKCRIVKGDFQKLSEHFTGDSFDVAFAVEATCHSPKRVECFAGVNYCLKKGGLFAGYEWIVLPERGFDASNSDHVRIKEGIEVGNGLPTLATKEDVIKALQDSGFEVLDYFDANSNLHSNTEIPWYATLKGSMTLSGFRMSRLGRVCTHFILSTLEFLRIAPVGTTKVSNLLRATALDLVEGGEKEIFTPSFFFLARKK